MYAVWLHFFGALLSGLLSGILANLLQTAGGRKRGRKIFKKMCENAHKELLLNQEKDGSSVEPHSTHALKSLALLPAFADQDSLNELFFALTQYINASEDARFCLNQASSSRLRSSQAACEVALRQAIALDR